MFPRLTRVCIFLGIVAYIPGIPPDLDFESFSLSPANVDARLIEERLNNVERLFENDIHGPEHLQVYNDELYFTTTSGLLKMNENNTLSQVYRVDDKCGKAVCGRPLGFTFGEDGLVYLADAYNGVIKINPKTGKSETLVSINDAIDGKRSKLPNSIIQSKETGKIYWTDSSTELPLHQLLFLVLGNGKGRLIEYDPATKVNRVLIDRIHFANGVMLAEDESFVMVAETNKARILRYYLKGEKAKTTDVFIDNLPGFVDNINKLGDDLFVVAIVDNIGALSKFSNSLGVLRKLIVRFLSLSQLIIGPFTPWIPPLDTLHYYLSSYDLASLALPRDSRASCVLFNSAGQIKRVLQGTDGSSHTITSLAEFKGYYYMGSFVNPYLARVVST